MSNRLWLIDGHNVIFAVPLLREMQVGDRREQARAALADRLQRFAHARGEKVVIVFDGDEPRPAAGAGRRGPLLDVAYMRSAGGGADSRIIDLARQGAGKRLPVTVVTDDVSTLAGRLPPAVVHLSVREFWLKHIEPAPAPGVKRVEGDFSDVERELLEYSAAEAASAARAAATAGDPSGSGDARPTAPGSGHSAADSRHTGEPTSDQRLRLKRERGRLRQQRRFERGRRPRQRR